MTSNSDSDRTDSDKEIQSKVHRQVNGHKSNGHGDNSRTDTDDEGQVAKKKMIHQQHKEASKKRLPGKTRPGTGINLRDLLEENILTSGEDVLSVEYKGSITYATLSPEGHILCQLGGRDQRFESPSAFSIALKRLVNPLRKADDGWKTVKYNGRFLDVYKLELARRRLAGTQGDDEEISMEAPARKRSKTAHHSDVTSRPATPLSMDDIPKAGAVLVGSNVEDEAHMIPCERFRGEPCSSSGSQPFRVVVSPGAALLMDFHAHLSDNEVVGLLAGSWSPDERILRVEKAFPVQEAQDVEDMPTVEMVASDEKATKQRMANKANNLSCVGWYHSHPHAGTHPSNLDIREQMKQQKLHRSFVNGLEPYIGAIVSPYRGTSSSSEAEISYFHVDYPKDRDIPCDADPIAEGCLPMSLQVAEGEGPGTETYISNMPNNEMRAVAHRCARISRRADIMGAWDGEMKLEKIKRAVASRLPRTWNSRRVEEYGTKVEAIVTAAWKIFGQRQEQKVNPVRRLKGEEEELDISDVSAGNHTDSTRWN